jgi:hypothetical protein
LLLSVCKERLKLNPLLGFYKEKSSKKRKSNTDNKYRQQIPTTNTDFYPLKTRNDRQTISYQSGISAAGNE